MQKDDTYQLGLDYRPRLLRCIPGQVCSGGAALSPCDGSHREQRRREPCVVRRKSGRSREFAIGEGENVGTLFISPYVKLTTSAAKGSSDRRWRLPCVYCQGKYEEAEELFRRSVAIMRSPTDSENPGVYRRTNHLAGLLLKQVRSHELVRQTCCGGISEIGWPQMDLYYLLLGGSQGKYEEAEQLYRHLMSLAEVAFGTESPAFSLRLSNLAGLLLRQVRAPTAPIHLPGES